MLLRKWRHIVELAKQLLLGRDCKNCIYYTTREKLVSDHCMLEHYPGKGDDYPGHNLCTSYASYAIQNNNDFMRAIMLRKNYVTFDDMKYFVGRVEEYKDE